MLHRSSLHSFAEKRLLTFAPTPEAPKTPEVQLTKEIMETSPLDPEAKKHLAIADAGKDAATLKNDCREGWKKAAQAHYEAATKAEGTAKKSPEMAIKELNQIFEKAGVKFTVNAGKLEMHDLSAATPAASADKKPGAPEKKQLTPDQIKQIEEIQKSIPEPLKGITGPILEQIVGNPESMKGATAFRDAIKGTKEKIQTVEGLQKFISTLPPAAQEFGKAVMDSVQKLMTDKNKPEQLSDEDKKNISLSAAKAFGKFDASKATEGDKNMMIARLMMMGIDTADTASIFEYKPGPDGNVDEAAAVKCFKPMEGTKFERAMNQVMGLIGYVMIWIDKMNPNSANKKAEKQPNAPATAPAAGPDGKKTEAGAGTPGEKPTDAALKKDIKDKEGYNAVERDKTTALADAKKAIDGDPTGSTPEKKKGLREREKDLTKKDAELKANVDLLEADQKKLEAELTELKKQVPAVPAQITAKEDAIKTAKTRVEDKKKEKEKVGKDLQEVKDDRTKADARVTQAEGELKALKEYKERVEKQHKDINETLNKTRTALTTPPLNGLKSARAIVATLPALMGLDADKLEIGPPGGFVMKNGADAVRDAGGDASAWELDGTGLKNPDAFLASLNDVVKKVEGKSDETKNRVEDLKAKAHLDEAGAKQVVQIESQFGISFTVDGGVLKVANPGEGTTKQIYAVLTRGAPPLTGEIRDCLAKQMTTQLKALDENTLTFMLGKIPDKGAEWAQGNVVKQLIQLANKVGDIKAGIMYDPTTNQIVIPNTNVIKAKVKAPGDPAFETLDPLLKSRYS